MSEEITNRRVPGSTSLKAADRETGFYRYEDADFDEIEVGDWVYAVHAFEPEMFKVARIYVNEGSGLRRLFADGDKVPDFSRVPSVMEGHTPVRKRIWHHLHYGVCFGSGIDCAICESAVTA